MDSFVLVIIVLFVAIGICVLLFTYLTRPQYAENTILTEGEFRYFQVLESAISKRFIVCPQVRLANIVQLKGLFVWQHFRPLGAKCVDFVLLDRKTGKTMLIIELDDKSHLRKDRKKRDYFVNYVLHNAHIPILHESYREQYDENTLAERIQQAIIKKTV